MTTVQSAIQAMLVSMAHGTDTANTRPIKPVVTLSRDHGALGRQIANALGQRLDVPVYDREILDKIAKRLDTDPKTLKTLDETVARARDMWLLRLFTGQDLTADTYRMHLVNVILALGRTGGILLGRGANIILSTSCALRVRITASPEVRQRRIAERHGISEKEAHQQIVEIDANRSRFVQELFHRRNDDPSTYDVMVNTDRFIGIDPVVNMLLSAHDSIIHDDVTASPPRDVP